MIVVAVVAVVDFFFFFHFSSNVIASLGGNDLILGTAARVCKSCAATINLFSFSLLLCTRKKKTPNEPLISFHMHPCYFSTLPHTFLSLSFSSIFFPCLQTYIMTLLDADFCLLRNYIGRESFSIHSFRCSHSLSFLKLFINFPAMPQMYRCICTRLLWNMHRGNSCRQKK